MVYIERKRTVWRIRFVSGLVLRVKQNAEWLHKQQQALCDAETCTLRKVYQKYPERTEMWCW